MQFWNVKFYAKNFLFKKYSYLFSMYYLILSFIFILKQRDFLYEISYTGKLYFYGWTNYTSLLLVNTIILKGNVPLRYHFSSNRTPLCPSRGMFNTNFT